MVKHLQILLTDKNYGGGFIPLPLLKQLDMILKKGVNINGIRTELLFALNVCDKVYESYSEELVITSLNDSNHSETSLHYSNAGADLRTRYFDSGEVQAVAQDIRDRLGKDYDVIIEKDHIHLEYQPRKR